VKTKNLKIVCKFGAGIETHPLVFGVKISAVSSHDGYFTANQKIFFTPVL
jgi:hypothetical protein